MNKGDLIDVVAKTTCSKAEAGRNPQNGKPIKIAAKKVPKFTAGKGLKAAVAK
jgi:nucleoid DNA-binding protein